MTRQAEFQMINRRSIMNSSLQAARSHMLTDDIDASSAAVEVGYESVSQFNREYTRLFGQPPMRDIKALRCSGLPG